MASPSRSVTRGFTGVSSCDTHLKVVKLSYTWRVHNFSMRREERGQKIESSHFSAAGYDNLKWCLIMYPNGEVDEGKGIDFVSLYMCLASSDKKDVHAECKVAILNEGGQKINLCKATNCYAPGGSWGWKKFIERARLLKGADRLLTHDKLTISCEVLAFVDSVNLPVPNRVVSVNVPECNLSEDFGHLLTSSQLSDVILSVEGKEIRAHKVVLAARSPVFAAMFEHGMKEEKEGRVEITDCDFEALHQVIKYIYAGHAPELNKKAKDVLVAANKYDLGRLKAMCEDVLSSKLSVGTAVETLALADMHNADQLKANALRFIKAHAAEVKETDGWTTIATERPHLALEAFCAVADEIVVLNIHSGSK